MNERKLRIVIVLCCCVVNHDLIADALSVSLSPVSLEVITFFEEKVQNKSIPWPYNVISASTLMTYFAPVT